jgi:hypothetical protein
MADRGGVLNGPLKCEVIVVERIPSAHVRSRVAAILARMLRTPVAPDEGGTGCAHDWQSSASARTRHARRRS